MRWQRKSQIPRTQWHRWFAWFPVAISDQEIAWLETVGRKRYWSCDGDSWSYGPLEMISPALEEDEW